MAHENATEQPAKAGFFSSAKPAAERVNDAIEAWYAKHYHSAALAGRAPISADEKAALVAHITAAVNHED